MTATKRALANFPEKVYRVGRADQIWYYSDKWEADGDGHTYYHDCTSHPFVYCGEDSFLMKHADKRLVEKTSKSLLKVKSVHGEIPLSYLAVTLELTVNFGKHKKRFKFSAKQPPMCEHHNRSRL